MDSHRGAFLVNNSGLKANAFESADALTIMGRQGSVVFTKGGPGEPLKDAERHGCLGSLMQKPLFLHEIHESKDKEECPSQRLSAHGDSSPERW